MTTIVSTPRYTGPERRCNLARRQDVRTLRDLLARGILEPAEVGRALDRLGLPFEAQARIVRAAIQPT